MTLNINAQSALVIDRAYLDWQAKDHPADYVEGMSFGEFAMARLALCDEVDRLRGLLDHCETALAAAARLTAAGLGHHVDICPCDICTASRNARAALAELRAAKADETKG